MGRRTQELVKHSVLLVFLLATVFPFVLIVINSLRTTPEINRGAIGFPHLIGQYMGVPASEPANGEKLAFSDFWYQLTIGYKRAWKAMGRYVPNTVFVALATGLGIVVVSSLCAFALARYRFPGARGLYVMVISMMMIPGVLTLIPAFLLIKNLGMLNSYSGLIFPYIAGGQVLAIFLLKGFFDDLPQDLFDSAKIDGAGVMRLYWHIAFPLSKPIIYLIMAMNILAVWNNFIWPYVINNVPKYQLVPSGVYLLSRQLGGQGDLQSLFASYVLSAIPMLILFMIATRAFLRGITAGAFKA